MQKLTSSTERSKKMLQPHQAWLELHVVGTELLELPGVGAIFFLRQLTDLAGAPDFAILTYRRKKNICPPPPSPAISEGNCRPPY